MAQAMLLYIQLYLHEWQSLSQRFEDVFCICKVNVYLVGFTVPNLSVLCRSLQSLSVDRCHAMAPLHLCPTLATCKA